MVQTNFFAVLTLKISTDVYISSIDAFKVIIHTHLGVNTYFSAFTFTCKPLQILSIIPHTHSPSAQSTSSYVCFLFLMGEGCLYSLLWGICFPALDNDTAYLTWREISLASLTFGRLLWNMTRVSSEIQNVILLSWMCLPFAVP